MIYGSSLVGIVGLSVDALAEAVVVPKHLYDSIWLVDYNIQSCPRSKEPDRLGRTVFFQPARRSLLYCMVPGRG